MRMFARFLLLFGALLPVLSLLLMPYVDSGSVEWHLCTLNIILGGLMLAAAVVYLVCSKTSSDKHNRGGDSK